MSAHDFNFLDGFLTTVKWVIAVRTCAISGGVLAPGDALVGAFLDHWQEPRRVCHFYMQNEALAKAQCALVAIFLIV